MNMYAYIHIYTHIHTKRDIHTYRYVLTSGEKSTRLSMYNTETGATVSRGDIGKCDLCICACMYLNYVCVCMHVLDLCVCVHACT